MARRKPILTVRIASSAADDLDRIWAYNATQFGRQRADAWDAFLVSVIERLGSDYGMGRSVDDVPELQFVTARKRPRAHGHIIVYEVDAEQAVVFVLHIFHTSQDWKTKF